MDTFQTFILLMFAAVILVNVAQKMHIPYPITLILGGTAIGFNPYVPVVNFDPNLILVIVLPPILYYASFGISYREFKQNWRTILSLALGLVGFTTLVVGLVFKWLFPEYPWALAFTFGAIVSPPDAIAASAILKRFAISNRLLTILEGESLVNDASAIVLYRIAVVALLSGVFSLGEASLVFVKTVSGGIAVGAVLGYLLQHFSRRYLEPVVGVLFSFTIPYVTYIAADFLGFSGVLAVVVNGLMGSQLLLRHYSSLRRILGFAAWDIFSILMNCFVFILIGLELRSITSAMTLEQMLKYAGYALLITLAMIAVRMFWVYSKSAVDYLRALGKPKSNVICPQILREAAIIGWSGMRGIVSLAAALAIPFTLPSGMPVEGRNVVIFMTFVVISLTLVIPGLTLSSLIRLLNIQYQPEFHSALKVREQLAKVAEATINHLYHNKMINSAEHDLLIEFHCFKTRELAAAVEQKLQNMESARNKVIQEMRKKLLELWENFDVDDKLFAQIEHELDLEETRLARAELK